MTDQPIYAEDRLQHLEENVNELIEWNRDVSRDIELLAELADGLRLVAADLVDTIRAQVVPGTDPHLRLTQAVHKLTDLNTLVLDRAAQVTAATLEATA